MDDKYPVGPFRRRADEFFSSVLNEHAPERELIWSLPHCCLWNLAESKLDGVFPILYEEKHITGCRAL